MKSTILRAAVLALGLGVFAPAISQAKNYSNPDANPWHLTTVAYLKEHQKDDKYVVLIGKVTEKVGSETYYFRDGTGRIKIESEKHLPVGKYIVIRGHYDEDWIGFTTDTINVKSWRYDSKKDRE